LAQVSLPNTQRQHLVKLIATRAGAHTPTERQNLLDAADLALFAGRVNLSADTESFSQQLVRELQNYGTLEATGQPALVSLLRWLRERVRGQEEEVAFVDGLLAPYGGAGTAASPQGSMPSTSASAIPPSSPQAAGPATGPAAGQLSGRCTVLFLAANPRQTTALRLGEEVRTIEERLRESTLRDRFDLRQQHAVRWSDLSRSLLENTPMVVHFAGHGEAGGEIVLEDPVGGNLPVGVDVLADLFRILKDDIRCVVLNACWSESQAAAIGQHIDFVVGMTRPISDPAAIRFAAGFYRGLGFGRSVQTAFHLGRNEMSAGAGGAGRDLKPTGQGSAAMGAGSSLSGIPKLLVREGMDAAATKLVQGEGG
jgi:hypothetical protein